MLWPFRRPNADMMIKTGVPKSGRGKLQRGVLESLRRGCHDSTLKRWRKFIKINVFTKLISKNIKRSV